jgi:hypothetical protein
VFLFTLWHSPEKSLRCSNTRIYQKKKVQGGAPCPIFGLFYFISKTESKDNMYNSVGARLQNFHLNPDGQDRIVWRWSPSGCCSSRTAYQTLFLGEMALQGANKLWKVRAQNKCRFFLRLVIHGRCLTSERLQRHGLCNNGPCALCSHATKTFDHLLIQCV